MQAGSEQIESSKSLHASFVSSDKRHCDITIQYDDSAGIPDGANLCVKEVDTEDNRKALHESFARELNLQDGDRVLQETYLDVSILASGRAMAPESSVVVTIETDAFPSEQSSSIEMAILGSDNTPGEHVLPQDLTQADAPTKLRFDAKRLGTLAIGTVVGRLATWQQTDLNVHVDGPRFGMSIATDDTEAPATEEGIEPQECIQLSIDPAPTHETTLWVEAIPTEDATSQESELGGTIGYITKEGKEPRELFRSDGTKEPAVFDPHSEQLLIAWDTGYRKSLLDLQAVTIEGMLPTDTTGAISDVAGQYEDPTQAIRGAFKQQSQDSDDLEYETISAYDITLETDGREYQPDEEHPLLVTIFDEGISLEEDQQLWHIQNDGTLTEVPNAEFVSGAVSFEAKGFSTYLVTSANSVDAEPTVALTAEPAEEPVTTLQALSTSFKFTATAKNYSRSSTVTFIDQNGNRLNGTVTGTITRSYTGLTDDKNDTNSIDMYTFADKLDPDIADEYDFSRVYLHLNNGKGDQKDFRYIQIGDETNIGVSGSGTTYRAYIHMVSIDQNRANQDYNGTWYQLSVGGNMDPIFIEFYHMAECSFYAKDIRDNPVKDAEFTLYTDSSCHTPLKYNDQEIVATSDRTGLVSFGRIPRGTYYMKETVIPDGFKKTTKVHTIVVDGESEIPDVVHEDDDGSVIVSDVYQMSITKVWDDGEDHTGDVVSITVTCDDEEYAEFELSKNCNWTHTLQSLDPNKSYVISETAIRDAENNDLMPDWAPDISTKINEQNVFNEYYRADSFQQGKEYVLVANPGTDDSKALTGGSSLTPEALETTDDKITGTVTDYMVWKVTSVSDDGVIVLQNEGNELYLDQADGKKWFQNEDTPLFVRHTNDNGVINIYFRKNINITTTYYLYMRNVVDRTTKASDAADFAIYNKLTVHATDVTVNNKPTTYPIKIKDVEYPSDDPIEGMEYNLYDADKYQANSSATPLYEGLTAGEDGFLAKSGSSVINLEAGSYYLVQQTTKDGYEPTYASPDKPLRFTVTRKGKLGIEGTYGIKYYDFCSTITEGDTEYPLLRVPHYKPGTVEIQLDVQGDYADLTKEFDFTIDIPITTDAVQATVNGTATEFTASNRTFKLAHGQTLRLEGVLQGSQYTITQKETDYDAHVEALTPNTITVAATDSTGRAFTFMDPLGTETDPSRVKITNSFTSGQVAITGLDGGTTAGAVLAILGIGGLVGRFLLRHRRDTGM